MDHGKILTKKKLMGLPDILFEIISFFELKIRSQSDLHHLGWDLTAESKKEGNQKQLN
jgi:hypothetical protein